MSDIYPSLIDDLFATLAKCEAVLEANEKLNEAQCKAVLNARLALIRRGVDMAKVAGRFPLLDHALTCDSDGNPLWYLWRRPSDV